MFKAISLAVVAGAFGLFAAAGSARSQDARWTMRTLVESGPDEASTCARARARAADLARAFQGLNIQRCQCRRIAPASDPEGNGLSCRLTYEVLVRVPETTTQRDQQERRDD